MGDFGDDIGGGFGSDIWKKIISATSDINPIAGAAQDAIKDPSSSAPPSGSSGLSQGASNFLGLGLDGKPNADAQSGKISPFGKIVGDATKAATTPAAADTSKGGAPSAPAMAAPTPIMPPQSPAPVTVAAGGAAGAGMMPGGQQQGAPPGLGGFTRPHPVMPGANQAGMGNGQQPMNMSPFGRKPY